MNKLLIISKRAFYPIHWQAFRIICKKYKLKGFVITTDKTKIPLSHQQVGWINPKDESRKGFSPEIFYLPNTNLLSQTIGLLIVLRKIRPDYIWVQEEPIDENLLVVLARYFFHRNKPVIISAICENIFHPASWWFQPIRVLLWFRLDGLLPVASPSLQAIYKVGMPQNIPVQPLVAGSLAPPRKRPQFKMPFKKTKGTFVVGYVARLVEEKGWRTLLEALNYLPKKIKCFIVGSGGQQEEIDRIISQKKYKNRIYRFNVMPKARLWGFYNVLDCLVLPSIDSANWIEQSGGVLGDAMSMGIPIVGSNSGGIPEITGEAGLIFTQRDTLALAGNIKRLFYNSGLAVKLGREGKKRFRTEFSIPVYSQKIARGLKLTL